ncbi:MAG: hypothetical protein U1E27_01430, partial [Kiritimatiellia bacterium]|nr:hypothetical protein [Kiritimatiellia bacterium]
MKSLSQVLTSFIAISIFAAEGSINAAEERSCDKGGINTIATDSSSCKTLFTEKEGEVSLHSRFVAYNASLPFDIIDHDEKL